MKTNPFKPSKAVLAFALGLLLVACESEAERKTKADAQAHQEKYAKAKALFEERCKTAGVVIHRTVKDVEGIELTKIRQPIPWGGKEYFDPMWPEAAMAGEHRGDNYIKQFLMSEFVVDERPKERGSLGPPTSKESDSRITLKRGFRFIEFLDHSNKQRYRCVPDWSRDHPNWVDGQHHCKPVEHSSARYALDYDDILAPADRQLWVAGTRLKVIDKQNGEVVAQLTRFVWEPGFGGSSTGRWPWQHANSSASTEPVRKFVCEA